MRSIMGTTGSKKGAYTQEEARPFHDKLRVLRARVVGDTTHLAEGALNQSRGESSGDLSKMPIHMADIGSDAYEQEFSLDLLAAEQATLTEIDSALARIEAGEYGACVNCGKRIKKTRLHAIPFTPICIDCATERDQESRG
ncbi:TraR/DksA family transcriptional regulator [Blastopirellula marina]|nr:TraR/DksA family transcriptional regulator [Blastopirellula marina]